MDSSEARKYGIPLLTATLLLLVIIVFGLASQDPDGFEWSLFDFAGVTEPEGGFQGSSAFLGNGMIADVVAGITGIIAILLLGYGLFWISSRKSR